MTTDDLSPAALAQLEDAASHEAGGAAGIVCGAGGTTALLDELVGAGLMEKREGSPGQRPLYVVTPAGLARITGSGTFRAAKERA